jgi:hypothetical protein
LKAGTQEGAVAASSCCSQRMACSRLLPHISADGCRPPQKAGRSGRPKIRQRLSSASWMQRTPAGLPCGVRGRLKGGAAQSRTDLLCAIARATSPMPVLKIAAASELCENEAWLPQNQNQKRRERMSPLPSPIARK